MFDLDIKLGPGQRLLENELKKQMTKTTVLPHPRRKNFALKLICSVANLEGVQRVCLNPPFETKLFHFHGDILEKS